MVNDDGNLPLRLIYNDNGSSLTQDGKDMNER